MRKLFLTLEYTLLHNLDIIILLTNKQYQQINYKNVLKMSISKPHGGI
jgi:hypothetical protein